MFALVDCNNFFASCEQVFAPHLRHKPLVVLSNNDGCIIARSHEAKALGIPMGAPYFQWRDFFERHRVKILSSNFTLYADMSSRVVATLEDFGFPLEIYSIDESFLTLDKEVDPHLLGQSIHQKVKQWTGLPTSVGVAPTKTLAKIANQRAKKDPSFQNVCVFKPEDNLDDYLKTLPIREVWGIGRRLTKQLHSYGIQTAFELKSLDDAWVRRKFSVTGLRTVWELRGISCSDYEGEESVRKSVLKSRSFTKPLTHYGDIEEAIASFTARAAEKLRKDGLSAGHLTLFIMTSRFDTQNLYANQGSIVLPQRSAYTPELIAAAKRALKKIYIEGLEYKRAGIILTDLSSSQCTQLDIFSLEEGLPDEKKDLLMETLDTINRRYGKKSLFSAAEGLKNNWYSPPQLCSAHYTTSWKDLLTIRIS